MPQQVQTGSYKTRLPFHVNDVGQDSLFSVTVASGTANIPAGTVMSKNGDGEFEPYEDAGGTAFGILVNDVDPSDGEELGSLMVMGVVRSGSLFGLDAGAMADLENHFIFV
jgi:hypothetical protein